MEFDTTEAYSLLIMLRKLNLVEHEIYTQIGSNTEEFTHHIHDAVSLSDSSVGKSLICNGNQFTLENTLDRGLSKD